jgi:hypothetical protein
MSSLVGIAFVVAAGIGAERTGARSEPVPHHDQPVMACT